ncbi:MAG: insulinase family protein [Clostridiales bacterium]|nr:insulinase family protein [Clostridiales bacterium]
MKIKQYSSGLRVVVNTKKDLDIVSFKAFINCGAKDEQPNEYGIAHILEHMFFKSTPNYSYQELDSIFDELGVRKNAYTSVTRTCYYFTCLNSVLNKITPVFADMFFNIDFNKNELDNEKFVILEELKMGNDNPETKCVNEAYSNLFKATNFEHMVIGNAKTIKATTTENLKNFKQKHYLPQNIVISVSGNITFAQVEKLLKKYFAPLFDGEYKQQYALEPYKELSPKQKYVANIKQNDQSVVYILTDLGKTTEQQRYSYDIFFAILGYGTSSKLFSSIRSEKGLVYYISASATLVANNSLGEIMFATSNDKVGAVLEEVVEIIKDCKNGNITEKDLSKAKNKFIASVIYENETNSAISGKNGTSLLLENKIDDDKKIVEYYNSVTLEDVLNCAKMFTNFKNYVVSSVGNCNKNDLKKYKL